MQVYYLSKKSNNKLNDCNFVNVIAILGSRYLCEKFFSALIEILPINLKCINAYKYNNTKYFTTRYIYQDKTRKTKQKINFKNTLFFFCKNRMFLGYNYDKVVSLNIGTDVIMSYKLINNLI